MLPVQLVCGNEALAHAVLSRHDAIQCARSVLPHYPLPPSDHEMWTTDLGRVLEDCMDELEMSHANVRQSPDAFAIKLLPAGWRAEAMKLAQQRLLQAEDAPQMAEMMIEQHMHEQSCSKAMARLQLAAARVTVVAADFWPGTAAVRAYVVYNSHGAHVYTTPVELEQPDEHCLLALPEDLDVTEQLTYLVLTENLADQFGRVTWSQPLALGNSQHPAAPSLAKLLTFCDECCSNWTCDHTGTHTSILQCPEHGCDYTVHQRCCTSAHTCPYHPQRHLDEHHVATDESVSKSCTAVTCTGIMPVHGTWCFRLGRWTNSADAQPLLLLHPAAMKDVLAATDACIASGHWYAEDYTIPCATSGMMAGTRLNTTETSRRVLDTVAEAGALWHCNTTKSKPLRWLPPAKQHSAAQCHATADCTLASRPAQIVYQALDGLGQMSCLAAPVLRLATSVTSAIAALQVYSEPQFSRMCLRLQHVCGRDHLDAVIIQWMHHCMPLLCGEIDASSTESDASCMHARVHAAILSNKTRERALHGFHEHRHLCVAQEDAVLPNSREQEQVCLAKLGCSAALPVQPSTRAAATPDVIRAGRAIASSTTDIDYGLFAVQVLLFPRSNQAVLQRIIADAEHMLGLDGAYSTIMDGEQAWPSTSRALSRCHLLAFRAACVRSPIYGRIYLWLQTHGERYTGEWHHDATGILATDTHEMPCGGRWEAAAKIQLCTGAAYVALQCGSMAHWRRVLTHDKRSYLFSTDVRALRKLAEHPIHHGLVHVVPCCWRDMSLDELGCSPLVVTAAGPLPRVGCDAHVLCTHTQDGMQHMYEGQHSGWHYYASSQPLAAAARHACSVYDAMQTC